MSLPGVQRPLAQPREASGGAEIRAKALARHFVRGINRFDVAYCENGERQATEVVMDVQM